MRRPGAGSLGRSVGAVVAESGAFLGNDLLPWLVLAIGGALVVGNLLAIFRPPPTGTKKGDLPSAPVARSVIMVVIGLVAAVWAFASLVS